MPVEELQTPLAGVGYTTLQSPLLRRRRCGWVGVLAALALGGCGAPSLGDVHEAVGGAAHAAQAVTQLSQQLMRSWCPQAVAEGGRKLTEGQARGCLQRAWQDWLRELRRNGYDPGKVGGGP